MIATSLHRRSLERVAKYRASPRYHRADRETQDIPQRKRTSTGNHGSREVVALLTSPASASRRGGFSMTARYGSSREVTLGIRCLRPSRSSIRKRPSSWSASFAYAPRIAGSPFLGDAMARCSSWSRLFAIMARFRFSAMVSCGIDLNQSFSGCSTAFANCEKKSFLVATSTSKQSSNEDGSSRKMSEMRRARRVSVLVSTWERAPPK